MLDFFSHRDHRVHRVFRFFSVTLRTLREIFYKLKLVGLPASGWTARQSLFNDGVAFSKIVKSPDDFIVRSPYHVCKN